jgi:hypothetical protein
MIDISFQEELNNVKGAVGKWDGKISFIGAVGFLYQEYSKLYKKLQETGKLTKREWTRLLYTIIALIQLKNGIRSCEAVKAYIEMVNQKREEVNVLACKHGLPIEVIKPKQIPLSIMEEALKNKLPHFVKKGYDKNKIFYRLRRDYQQYFRDHPEWREMLDKSHSLRYAGMKQMAEAGMTYHEVARAVGHRKVETTYHYLKSQDVFKKKKDIMKEI